MRVSELQPGMTLTHPVRDITGRLLANGGTPMTERIIDVLKTWGVVEVEVSGQAPTPWAPDSVDDIPAELLHQAQDITSRRLQNNDLNLPFIQDIFRCSSLRLARRLHQGEAAPEMVLYAPDDAPHADATPVSIAALVACNPSLGAMPDAMARLTEVIQNPVASPTEVADILQTDPGLAAKVLKLVNSPLYGFHQSIDTISRAVTVIGVKQLSALALGVTVLSIFKGVPAGVIDARAFWRHSLATGCAARSLASQLGVPNTERFFVAGLLHDVGLMLLYMNVPERARQMLTAARHSGKGLVETERRLLGTDHGRVGGALLDSWKLPASLVEAAHFHHDPLMAENVREATILHVADFLAEAMGFGSCGIQTVMPLNLSAWSLLDIPDGAAQAVCERLESQLENLSDNMLGHV